MPCDGIHRRRTISTIPPITGHGAVWSPHLPGGSIGPVTIRRIPLSNEAEEREGDELTFDEALTRLEELAERLEEGDTPLEDALEVYEEAVGLFSHCRDRLTQVEQRLEKLSRDLDGGPATEPLSPPEETADDG